MNRLVFLAGTALALVPQSAFGQAAGGISQSAAVPTVADPALPPDVAAKADIKSSPQDEIVVTGKRLDAARDSIAPALGASDYSFNRATLDKQPGGANQSLTGVLLQAPGVTQDSYGAIHVRNEHGNLQYRLNGVIVPESISGFGATFDQRIASSIDLLTGTLPAQYGYRTSGVINLKSRSGAFDNGGDIGIYGGSRGTIQPSASLQGSSGGLNYFASGSYLQNDLGVENPLPTRDAIHDRTRQYRGFMFVSDILSDTSRISAFAGTSIGFFEIPNVPGQAPNFTVNGRSTFDSAKLDQRQREITHYGVLSYQYAGDSIDVQIAPFVRYSQTRFTADPNLGDVIFNGFADAARLSSLATGVQADASKKFGANHIVRFGLFAQNERTRSQIVSRVLPGTFDADGNFFQSSDVPLIITDRGGRNGQLYGIYLQDEWTLSPTLTLNYGARFDMVRAYTREQQLSPRANLVWRPTPRTTFHIGYARNFTPPPQELIAAPTLALFDDTAKQSSHLADPVRAEREHYFDAGFEQKLVPGLKVGIDAYYKIKRNLLDEGQFGSALVLSPFNYAKGKAWGVEGTVSYTHGPIDLYVNVARGDEKGKDIVSSQYFFAPKELNYIKDHYIFTDHSQRWTASGGGSVTLRDGVGTLVPSFDMVYGSGLRASDPAGIVPNGGELRSNFTVNAGLAQNFTGPGALKGVALRLDVRNLFDRSYLIRDGSGVGVGARQYGQRRGIFAGITKKF